MSSAGAILIVGTSEARRAANVALLTQAGHTVFDIATADEALAYIAAEAPPLVILDHDLSDIAAGVDFCRHIKQESDDTFILQISQTFADDPQAEIEIESCIDAYLVDPIEPREMLALVRSLLRLQKVESELRDSEDRLLLAQESAGLAILDWVIPTNTFVHSDNLAELFDLDPMGPGEVLSPSQLLERLHPDDLGALIAEFSTDGQTARNFDKEFRIVRRDGEVRWIGSRGRFFSGSGGSPERMLSLSFDVTQRKNAERSNAELASIVASSIDAIVSIDLAGNVTSWNAGADRLFGVASADPDQAIYRFRGADVSQLLQFPQRFPAASGAEAPTVALEVSRRCGPAILSAAGRVSARVPAPGLGAGALTAHRGLRSVGPADATVHVTTHESANAEAQAIASELRHRHLRDGIPWQEMAVLVRSATRSLPLLRRVLTAAGVPVASAPPTSSPLQASRRSRPCCWPCAVPTTRARSRRRWPASCSPGRSSVPTPRDPAPPRPAPCGPRRGPPGQAQPPSSAEVLRAAVAASALLLAGLPETLAWPARRLGELLEAARAAEGAGVRALGDLERLGRIPPVAAGVRRRRPRRPGRRPLPRRGRLAVRLCREGQ